MTSTTLSYLQVIGGAASLIVPALQLMHNKERGKYFKRITPIGGGIIVVAAYMITTAFWSIGVTNKEKKVEQDSLVDKMSERFEKALNRAGKTYDPKTNTIHDTQTVFFTLRSKNNSVSLEESSLQINIPILKPINKNSFALSIPIKNVTNGEAFNIIDYLWDINIRDGIIYSFPLHGSASTELTRFTKGEEKLLDNLVDFKNRISADTDYLYVKILYTDKYTKLRKITRGIYFTPNNFQPASISEINSLQLPIVKAFLIRKHLW